MTINYKLIGRRVRVVRIRMDISQAGLAELIERSDSYISNIETAKSKIGLETLVRSANALQVSTDYLLGGNLLNNMGIVAADLALLLDGCTAYERPAIKSQGGNGTKRNESIKGINAYQQSAEKTALGENE